MRVLVTEYILSTFQPSHSYLDLLSEGYAMAITIAKALQREDVEVFLTLSSEGLRIAWDKQISLNRDEYFSWLKESKRIFDWILVIAPPLELIKISRIANEKLLGPSPQLVEIFSNKYLTYVALKKCGIDVPPTVLIRDKRINVDDLKELNPPFIVKPTLMAGSECVYNVKDRNRLLDYIHKAMECDPQGEVIVQEYIDGVHGSISAIYTKDRCLLYSLNLQLIIFDGDRLKFVGGILPIRSKGEVSKVRTIVEKLLTCYPALKGYIGLDVVWNEEKMYVVEVNPRPTTSVIGIAKIYPKFGEVLLSSVLYSRVDSVHEFLGDIVEGYAYYVLLNRYVSIHKNEELIHIEPSPRRILTGISHSNTTVSKRVKELLTSYAIVYDFSRLLQ